MTDPLVVLAVGLVGVASTVTLLAYVFRTPRTPQVDPIPWLTDLADRDRYGTERLRPRPAGAPVPPRVAAAVDAVERSRPGFTRLVETPSATYWPCEHRWPDGLEQGEALSLIAHGDADVAHILWTDRATPDWSRHLLLAVYRHRFECDLRPDGGRRLYVVQPPPTEALDLPPTRAFDARDL